MDVCLICWLLNFVGMLNMSRCEKLVVDRWCWRRWWWWWRRRRRLRLFSLSSLSIICTIGLRLLLWFLSWKTERKEKRERERARKRERERKKKGNARKMEKESVVISQKKVMVKERLRWASSPYSPSYGLQFIDESINILSSFSVCHSVHSFITFISEKRDGEGDRESWQEKELTILRSLLLVVRVIIFNFDGSLATVKNMQRKRQKNWFSFLSFFSLPLLSPLWLIVY